MKNHDHFFAIYLFMLACFFGGSFSVAETYTDEQKGWALGASAILNHAKKKEIHLLGGMSEGKEGAVFSKEVLSGSWGIESRDDLLEALKWIEREGHREEFKKLSKMTRSRLNAMKTEAHDDSNLLHRIEMAEKYGSALKEKSLWGWDYSRYMILCGWGYLAGYLKENEAWSKIMPAAKVLQKRFESWEDFGQNYLIGREFWSRDKTDEDGVEFVKSFEFLKSDPKSPWNTYPWNLDLDQK